jgi:hypothetical protein
MGVVSVGKGKAPTPGDAGASCASIHRLGECSNRCPNATSAGLRALGRVAKRKDPERGAPGSRVRIGRVLKVRSDGPDITPGEADSWEGNQKNGPPPLNR